MGNFIKSGNSHTLKFYLHTLSCHFWLNLWSVSHSMELLDPNLDHGISQWKIIQWNVISHWLSQGLQKTFSKRTFGIIIIWEELKHNYWRYHNLLLHPKSQPSDKLYKKTQNFASTHCGLETSIGDRNLGQSTLAQVMASCLMAPSHYLSQCWLMISEVLWHT